MVNQKNAKDNCPRCVEGKMVTDNESGEMFCSKCGFVMSEKIQESGLNGDHLLKTSMVTGQELEHQHHLQCMIWVLQQLSIQLTKTHQVTHLLLL